MMPVPAHVTGVSVGVGISLASFRRFCAAAAAQRGVPLAVLDVRTGKASQYYRHKLVRVRPDQHVAWRGDAEPDDSLKLIDLVRGAVPASTAISA